MPGISDEALGPPHATAAADAGTTSSAVPADLRAYSKAAVQIDEQIHELAQRLRGVLEAYRATKPQFGRPIPGIEDDLGRYARRCLEIDHWVACVADAFEQAGQLTAAPTVSPETSAPTARLTPPPVTVDDATLESALEEVCRTKQRSARPPAPQPRQRHDDGGVLGFLGGLKDEAIHALEHPLDTVANLAGHAVDADLSFVKGFADGMNELATAAWMLSRVLPVAPTWYFSMAADPAGTLQLQEKFAKGLLHMAADPVGTLGTMIDAKDLERGDVFRWAGHITPQVALTLATAGAGAGADAAAAGAEGIAEAAGGEAVAASGVASTEEAAGVLREQIAWVVRREAPLGMTPEQFVEFKSSLLDALRRDGIEAGETDIRLHGSGANVYSGIHKTLPTEADLTENPEALARLREWLGDDPHRPLRRPFDSMHRLGLDEPSDYDINISNDRMMEIARGRWDPDKFDGPMLKGHGYLEKEFMRTVFPQLQAWSDLWTSRLGRDISHAVFDSKGPFDTSQIGQGISVHFREETDWIIHSPGRP